MRASLLTAMASTAIAGTIMFLFPGHQVTTPAYALTSPHGQLTRPFTPDVAIPLPAGIAGYGVPKMPDFALPKGAFKNSNLVDFRRYSSPAPRPLATRRPDTRADGTVPPLVVPGDSQDTTVISIFVEGTGYATSRAELLLGVNRTKRIAFHGIDLSLPENQTSLYDRIRSAVKQVCRPRGFSRTEKLDIAKCEADALARAMPKVEPSIMRAQQSQRLHTN